jgi:shikimate dehydrogenase
VLGSPIAHSLSPALHRAAYEVLGLAWTYEAIDVTEDALAGFIAAMDASWAGLSLTMPLKERVLDLLVEVDPLAEALRAVNTVLPAPEGAWRGTNTDVFGMTQSLREAGIASESRRGTILGGGATARSAVAALADLGVEEITVCARRPEAAKDVAAVGERLGVSVECATLAPNAELVEVDVLVSTLPGDAAAPWAAVVGSTRAALLDASYHPWPSPLAVAWPGSVIANGRGMLLWQAVEQVRLMTGLPAPVDAMRAALAD